jgi:hypothetical protein
MLAGWNHRFSSGVLGTRPSLPEFALAVNAGGRESRE